MHTHPRSRARCAASMLLLLSLLSPGLAQSAEQRKPPDMPLTPMQREKVLDTALQKIQRYYVSKTDGARIVQALQDLRHKGQYDAVATAETLVPKLNADMLAIGHDPHLRLGYSYEPSPVRPDDQEDTPAEREADRKAWALRNYGLSTARVLDGNIGYLELNGFADVDFAADTLDDAMGFLHDTDALIIDLRGSDGGSPEMVAYIVSHFMPGEPVHLSDLYVGFTGKTRQFWTSPVPERLQYTRKDVYILTAKRVFSAAEGLAYEMQALKRAVVVGETTRGGANPGKFYSIDEHFALFVPTGSVTSAVTDTNWEGKGVTPDVQVAADQALVKAQSLALQSLMANSADPDRKQELGELLKSLQL